MHIHVALLAYSQDCVVCLSLAHGPDCCCLVTAENWIKRIGTCTLATQRLEGENCNFKIIFLHGSPERDDVSR